MKKFLFLLVVGFSMMFATNGSAQGYIKVNPLGMAFGQYGLFFEQTVNENSSFLLGVSYRKLGSQNVSHTGFGTKIQYRFYLSHPDAPKGFFIAPEIGANFMKYADDSKNTLVEDFKYSVFTFGALIGYQWLFSDDRFSFELGAGPAYYMYVVDKKYNNIGLGGSILPIASLSLGYRLVE